jgi:transcriptional regulator with XRE-family HTH domain
MNKKIDISAAGKATDERRAAIIAALVTLRKQRGISQSQVSRLLGMSVSNISRFESGTHNPTLDALLRYAQAIDVHIAIDGKVPLPTDAVPDLGVTTEPVPVSYDFREQELLMVAEPQVDDYDASEIIRNVTSYELRLYDQVLMIFTVDITDNPDWGPTMIDYVDKASEHLLPPELLGEEKDVLRWLKHRNIPKSRQHFTYILMSLGLGPRRIKGILDVGKALSLNDSYWVVPQGFKGEFKDFNLYENSFSATLSLVAYTGESQKVKRFHTSPELSTNGMLPKAWRRLENDGIYLYKGGTTGGVNTGLEPYSEFYAYQIAAAMGLDATPYDLVRWKGMLASKCRLFTDIETSFVPIGRLVTFEDEHGYMKDHIEVLLDFYGKLGRDFENALRSMLVFDSIIYNTDRHYGNFGLLRENSSGEYIAPAPIFDNGLSLLCYAMDYDLTSYDSDYMREYLFPVSELSFDEQARRVIGRLQRQQLRRLLRFEFTPHPRYNLEPKRLEFLNQFVRYRVRTLLELE